jgi:hypothetical protein
MMWCTSILIPQKRWQMQQHRADETKAFSFTLGGKLIFIYFAQRRALATAR